MNRKGGCLTAARFKGMKNIKALNRTIAWATINMWGTPIHLFNIYVDPKDAELAERTLANLKGLVESLKEKEAIPRLIISGDFN